MTRKVLISVLAAAVLAPALTAAVSPGTREEAADPAAKGTTAVFREWTTWTTHDGLPSDKIFALAAEDLDGHDGVLWVGTDSGLVKMEGDGAKITVYDRDDGLVYPVISHLAHDPATGDLWIATFAGLSRFSGDRFESFTQLNSGLANDVVYGVAMEGRWLWAATAAGTSRYDTWTGTWEIFNNKNAPMHEIWCYGVTASEEHVYLAVWGGGVLRWDRQRKRWREFRDPDGEMELDLINDDGPVSDVVASVAYGEGYLWLGTYFGANRYDGRHWSGYSKDNSGLASDFVNFVLADGASAFFATDDGLSHFDGVTWTTYRRQAAPLSGGSIVLFRDGEEVLHVKTPTALAHNFVSTVLRRGDEIWAGTVKGLSRGRDLSQP